MNIQFAVKDGEVYVLEVNPRASRTVPFVSKATGLNLAQAAARVMVGRTLDEQGITTEPVPSYVSVKEAVFPFTKFPGVDIVLGPRDAVDRRGDGDRHGLPRRVRQEPARGLKPAAARRHGLHQRRARRPQGDRADRPPAGRHGLSTCSAPAALPRPLNEHGIDVEVVRKIHEGRPNVLDYLANGTIDLIVNTPSGKGARTDEGRIRASAVTHGVPCITTHRRCPRGRRRHGTAQRRKAERLCTSRFTIKGRP